MTKPLSVYFNNIKVYEYDKNTRQPGTQRRFYNEMDLDMEQGIELNSEIINSPDKMQRAHYVVMNLLYGIEKNDDGLISATCGYLANRLPELKQIHATDKGEDIILDLLLNDVN